MTSAIFPALPEDNLRALEQLRQRLSQLSTSLASLKTDLERNDIPNWSSLQTAAQLVSLQLGQVQSTLSSNNKIFKAAHVYPLTTFPAHAQETLLNQLLRKRLEPSVEDWMARYEEPKQETGNKSDIERRRRQLQETWTRAGPTSKEIVLQMMEEGLFDDEFTIAEKELGIENVETGLNRKFWEEVDDEAEGDELDEDKMDGVQQNNNSSSDRPSLNQPTVNASQPSLENLLRLMSTGRLPTT